MTAADPRTDVAEVRAAAVDLLVETADLYPPRMRKQELTDTMLKYRAALASLYEATTDQS